MARGGARPGAGRKAGKSANTSPVSRGRAHAREAAGNQRPWPADKVEHRLLCGDSTVATDVERVLGGVTPHLMVTAPPYGVNYDAGWRGRRGLLGHRPGAALGKVLNDDAAD